MKTTHLLFALLGVLTALCGCNSNSSALQYAKEIDEEALLVELPDRIYYRSTGSTPENETEESEQIRCFNKKTGEDDIVVEFAPTESPLEGNSVENAWELPDHSGLALVLYSGGNEMQFLSLYRITLGKTEEIITVCGLSDDIDASLEEIPAIDKTEKGVKVYDPEAKRTTWYGLDCNPLQVQ